MNLEWLGEAIKAIYNSPDPRLTALGLVVVFLIVVVICATYVTVSYIKNKNQPKVVNGEKENKKNR